MEEYVWESSEEKIKKSIFEENNHIIEPRQMAKYFFSMLMVW